MNPPLLRMEKKNTALIFRGINFLFPHFPCSDVQERGLIAEIIFGNNSCRVDSV